MDRLNSEAIPRDQLALALKDSRLVHLARRVDRCLLCCGPRVDEAGLCRACGVLLSDEEMSLAKRWRIGGGP